MLQHYFYTILTPNTPIPSSINRTQSVPLAFTPLSARICLQSYVEPCSAFLNSLGAYTLQLLLLVISLYATAPPTGYCNCSEDGLHLKWNHHSVIHCILWLQDWCGYEFTASSCTVDLILLVIHCVIRNSTYMTWCSWRTESIISW